MSRPLFEREAGPVLPLSERLPRRDAAPARALLARSLPDVRPLFAEGTEVRDPAVAAAAAPVAPDPAELEREIAARAAEAIAAERRAADERLAAMEERLADALARLDRAARAAGKPSAYEVVELALIAAGELLGRELQVDRDHLMRVIDDALGTVEDGASRATVRLAPSDVAWLRAHAPARYAGLRLIEDPRLQPGGCVVETTQQIVDASIEARVDAVRAALVAAITAPEGDPS